MAIFISEITDSDQWDGFLTSQLRGHILQSYEWGELNKYLGGHIYRLGALDNGRLVGAMLVLVAQIPLPLKVPGIHFNWLYCCRGPVVEKLDSPALPALIEYAHGLARGVPESVANRQDAGAARRCARANGAGIDHRH